MAERSMAADCKSAGECLRRFESFSPHNAGVAQLVEHQPSKLRVASSNLVARSNAFFKQNERVPAYVAQSVEHFLGKEEVTGSSPVVGSGHCKQNLYGGFYVKGKI